MSRKYLNSLWIRPVFTIIPLNSLLIPQIGKFGIIFDTRPCEIDDLAVSSRQQEIGETMGMSGGGGWRDSGGCGRDGSGSARAVPAVQGRRRRRKGGGDTMVNSWPGQGVVAVAAAEAAQKRAAAAATAVGLLPQPSQMMTRVCGGVPSPLIEPKMGREGKGPT